MAHWDDKEYGQRLAEMADDGCLPYQLTARFEPLHPEFAKCDFGSFAGRVQATILLLTWLLWPADQARRRHFTDEWERRLNACQERWARVADGAASQQPEDAERSIELYEHLFDLLPLVKPQLPRFFVACRMAELMYALAQHGCKVTLSQHRLADAIRRLDQKGYRGPLRAKSHRYHEKSHKNHDLKYYIRIANEYEPVFPLVIGWHCWTSDYQPDEVVGDLDRTFFHDLILKGARTIISAASYADELAEQLVIERRSRFMRPGRHLRIRLQRPDHLAGGLIWLEKPERHILIHLERYRAAHANDPSEGAGEDNALLPADLNDDEWALLSPLVSPVRPGRRDVVGALFARLATGLPWQACSPRTPSKTVYSYFGNLRDSGRWPALYAVLVEVLAARGLPPATDPVLRPLHPTGKQPRGGMRRPGVSGVAIPRLRGLA